MSHIIISFWLMAAGSGAMPGEPSVSNAESQQLSSTPDAKHIGETMPAPVTSVTRLRMLPDGSLVQQCDIVEVKAGGRFDGRPRGEWIQAPEARIE